MTTLLISIDSLMRYFGYLVTVLTVLFGIYKYIKPIIASILKYNLIVSVDNINHINQIAYRALYHSENIVSHIGLPEYICTSTGECLYASPRLCEIFEKSESDMLGYGWSTSIIQEDRDRALHKWLDAVKNKLPYEDVYKIKTKNGNLLITTKTRVCFEYDAKRKKQTDKILFYIGSIYVNTIV